MQNYSNTHMGAAIDPIWEELHATQQWGQYPSEHVIRFVARNYYTMERSQVRILDFGAGGGAHTWFLAREGFDTYAFDGSSSAVNKVNQRLTKEKLGAHVRCMDGIDLKYESNFFDAIIDNVCIYTNLLNDINIMYKNCFRVLKPKGKLLTVAFGKRTTGFGKGKMLEVDTYTDITEGSLVNRGRVHFYDKNSFCKVLEGNGFKVCSLDTDYYTDSNSGVELLIAQCCKG